MTIHFLREKIEEARERREGVAGFSYDPDKPHNLNRKRGKVVGFQDIFTLLKEAPDAASDAGTEASGESESGGASESYGRRCRKASERFKMRRSCYATRCVAAKGVQEGRTKIRWREASDALMFCLNGDTDTIQAIYERMGCPPDDKKVSTEKLYREISLICFGSRMAEIDRYFNNNDLDYFGKGYV
jgi:hypothetical protein